MKFLEARVLQLTGGLHFIEEVQDSLYSWAFGNSGGSGDVGGGGDGISSSNSLGFSMGRFYRIHILLMRDTSVNGRDCISSLFR